jgi:hypothetical protein
MIHLTDLQKMKLMKFLSGLLATAGIFWAYFGFVGVVMSVVSALAIFAGEKTPLGYVYLYFQAWCGFFIWFGWIARALNCRYVVKRKTFWALSLIHHLFWFVPMILSYSKKGLGHDPELSAMLYLYIIVAIVISATGIFTDSEDKEADQDAAINPC